MNKICLFLILSVLSLVSCKKSEDEDPLIRRWYYYEMETVKIYNDGRPNESTTELVDDTREFLEFRNGGILESNNGDGTYSINNGLLEIRLNHNFISYRYRVDGDMLIMILPENNGSYETQKIYRWKRL